MTVLQTAPLTIWVRGHSKKKGIKRLGICKQKRRVIPPLYKYGLCYFLKDLAADQSLQPDSLQAFT